MCFTGTGYRNNRVSPLTYKSVYFEHYATVLMVLFGAWVACDSTPFFLLVARETESAFCRTATWGFSWRPHFHPGPRRATVFLYNSQ